MIVATHYEVFGFISTFILYAATPVIFASLNLSTGFHHLFPFFMFLNFSQHGSYALTVDEKSL